ncbi:hypothetical protein [Sphaerotilus mobilis]|uniref:Uncharacterized protein n=1 Tax=Sphaerotilus mobilis TaxID=47994 RepID=A0A4Q7LQ54_9BURK|nr:hypothetical protein [Sphaerotilus mobilis]RZS56724.1 hypothetical protein EV685_1278 [Sphaerotilus mobilis]
MSRLFEASSLAGIGLIVNAAPALLASRGTDPMAWGSLIAGALAIVKREGVRHGK